MGWRGRIRSFLDFDFDFDFEFDVAARHCHTVGGVKPITRAKSVAAYLVSSGIPADAVSSKGAGSAEPVASNATEAGRAQNRRTEITVN